MLCLEISSGGGGGGGGKTEVPRIKVGRHQKKGCGGDTMLTYYDLHNFQRGTLFLSCGEVNEHG